MDTKTILMQKCSFSQIFNELYYLLGTRDIMRQLIHRYYMNYNNYKANIEDSDTVK